MDDLGYLYVLANSSMPGIVKVGKTNRSPEERADELSGATGVPTPFLIIYHQLFSTCGEAELFVHTYLAQRGYRVANNREFFSAPVNEVIRAISLAPGAMSSDSTPTVKAEGVTDTLSACVEDEEQTTGKIWEQVLNEADGLLFGQGDYIQDTSKALHLYKQAVKLGCTAAYMDIGNIYSGGYGLKENREKADRYYKEGARKGNPYCLFKLGCDLHQKAYEHCYDRLNQKARDFLVDAEKYFILFGKNYPPLIPDRNDNDMFNMMLHFGFILDDLQKKNFPLFASLEKFLYEHTDLPIAKMKVMLSSHTMPSDNKNILKRYIEILEARKKARPQ